MEQNETMQSSMPMTDEEMMLRQKYLRQPNETKEQREQRKANVRKLITDSREAVTGVRNPSVISSFSIGRGAE